MACPSVGLLNIFDPRECRIDLRRGRLVRPHTHDKLVELDPVRARGPTDCLERLIELEAVPLGEDSLRLLDPDA
jgi:hypothetical protein